jgi:cytoskeletal protein RodZ
MGKKKKDEEPQEEVKKPKKKKIKKVDIAQNIAYSVLGILMAFVACIVFFALNPGLSETVKNFLTSGDGIEPQVTLVQEEKAEEAESEDKDQTADAGEGVSIETNEVPNTEYATQPGGSDE